MDFPLPAIGGVVFGIYFLLLTTGLVLIRIDLWDLRTAYAMPMPKPRPKELEDDDEEQKAGESKLQSNSDGNGGESKIVAPVSTNHDGNVQESKEKKEKSEKRKKELKKAKKRVSWFSDRFSAANFLTYLTILVKFVQLLAFAYAKAVIEECEGYVREVWDWLGTVFSTTALSFSVNLDWVPGWLPFALLCGLFVLTIFFALMFVLYNFTSILRWAQKGVLYTNIFLTGTLYIAIMKALLRTAACQEGETIYVVLTCWHDYHFIIVVFAFIGLLLFYPLASVTGPLLATHTSKDQYSDDVLFSPKYLFIIAQTDLILVILEVFFSAYNALAYLITALVITIGTCVLTFVMRPSYYPLINLWRGGAYLLNGWAFICSALAITYSEQFVIFTLGGGVAFILITMIIVSIILRATGKHKPNVNYEEDLEEEDEIELEKTKKTRRVKRRASHAIPDSPDLPDSAKDMRTENDVELNITTPPMEKPKAPERPMILRRMTAYEPPPPVFGEEAPPENDSRWKDPNNPNDRRPPKPPQSIIDQLDKQEREKKEQIQREAEEYDRKLAEYKAQMEIYVKEQERIQEAELKKQQQQDQYPIPTTQELTTQNLQIMTSDPTLGDSVSEYTEEEYTDEEDKSPEPKKKKRMVPKILENMSMSSYGSEDERKRQAEREKMKKKRKVENEKSVPKILRSMSIRDPRHH